MVCRMVHAYVRMPLEHIRPQSNNSVNDDGIVLCSDAMPFSPHRQLASRLLPRHHLLSSLRPAYFHRPSPQQHVFLACIQDLDALRDFAKEKFDLEIADLPMSISGRNWGSLAINNGSLMFTVDNRVAMELPLRDVGQASGLNALCVSGPQVFQSVSQGGQTSGHYDCQTDEGGPWHDALACCSVQGATIRLLADACYG